MTDAKPPAFRPGVDDPTGYDLRALEYLVGRYHGPVESAIEEIRGQRFAFPTMQELHDGNLDVELLYRQCLPAAGTAVALGLPEEGTARFLVLFATCQTLLLNNVDRHLDLSASYTLRDPTAMLRDVHAVTCYALAQLYRGMAMSGPSSAPALREMAGVSLHIIQSMYDNYARRFREDAVVSAHRRLAHYRDPVRSPHLGSGFYSSSVLALYRYFHLDPPADLPAILRDMRRLRQRVDELADVFEDTASGLLCYPVARLLAVPARRDAAATVVRSMWRRARRLLASAGGDAGRTNSVLTADRVLNRRYAELAEMLNDSGVMRICYDEADVLWRDLRVRIAHSDPRIVGVLHTVVDLKRAFLERLSLANWVDIPPAHTFDQIRSAVTGKGDDG